MRSATPPELAGKAKVELRKENFIPAREWVLTSSLFIVFIGFTLLVRFPFFFWPLSVDEGSYAYTAYWWFHGTQLYSDKLWFDRPQAIFLAFQAGMTLLGESTWAIRCWGALWSAATACVLFMLARRLTNQHAAICASILYTLFSAAPHVEGFTANAEIFMLLPATLAAYLIYIRQPLSAGFFVSMALLLKPSGIGACTFCVLWLFIDRASWRAWFAFLGASAILPIASIVHAALTSGLQAYLDAIVWYRLGVNVATGYQPENSPLAGWLITAPVWAPLVIVALTGLKSLSNRQRTFALLWFTTSVLGVAVGGHWIMHYFQQIIPPLTFFAGVGLSTVLKSTHPFRRGLDLTIIGLILSVFLTVEGPLFFAKPSAGMWQLYQRTGYTVATPAAEYIRSHSAPGDTIYVAFYEADIYHLAQRHSSSIYLFRLDLLYLLMPITVLSSRCSCANPSTYWI